MTHQHILKSVDDYYSHRLREHGANSRGVDWNSDQSQMLRFRQLLQILDPSSSDASGDRSSPVTLLDYGCGYGALVTHLQATAPHMRPIVYTGFDISDAMITAARALHSGAGLQTSFTACRDDLTLADYVVASGVLNVRGTIGVAEWESYVRDTLVDMNRLSRHGFAFNLLTSYSDPERMQGNLYYGNPCEYFDFCKRNFSRQVALFHDYGLYEFTLLVRHAPHV